MEILLGAHFAAGTFLESPAPQLDAINDKPSCEPLGTIIGSYRLLEQIGEGGMGVVYMAEETVPVQRKVALKIIKPGMDTRKVIARFEAERQALALMDHPNIAKMLNAGTTDDGRPYFVMELVKGVPIIQYCDEHRSPPRARLELFITVCQAVQHAHQKGIIHRDLKPTNILVADYDDRPVAKIIDFGVAKAVGQQLTERTMFTQFGQIVGTIEYMSPEQAKLNQLDIDTRTDIYSLGVLLYELLTGETPFDRQRLHSAAFDEMLRIIREEEPPKPSTRLSSSESLPSIAAQRQSEPKKLATLVSGDLDWIVMKAIEKDRSRRYETATGLVEDLQRYLHDEPVEACPPSAGYRVRKFARRNKGALITAALLTAALITTMLILAVSNVFVAQERDQKAQALKDKEEALRKESAARAKATQQESLAKEYADKAENERQVAANEALVAKRAEQLARRRFYNAQINLANQASEAGNPARVLDLLETQRPRVGEEDLRTFEWYYLWRLTHVGRCSVLRAHRGWVNALSFSPDSKTLASCSNDGTVKLWDVATGQLQTTCFAASPAAMTAVAFSPDGKLLAATGHDRLVRMWDVARRTQRWCLAGHIDLVWCLAFSPDGTTLATGSQDKTVRLWDVSKGQPITNFQGHDWPILSVAYSPDGKLLAAASTWKDYVKVWDVASRTEKFTVKGGCPVAFLPDGALVCLGHETGVTVWDMNTGAKRSEFNGDGGNIAAAITPDGKAVGFGTFDRKVVLWDVVKGANWAHHARNDPIHSLAFSPDGKLVTSGGDGGIIELWNAEAPRDFRELKQDMSPDSLNLSSDANTFVADTADGIKQWEVSTGMEKGRRITDTQNARHLSLSPDGKIVAAGDGTSIRLWNLGTQQEIGVLRGGTDDVVGIAFSPDGKTLASCGYIYAKTGTTKLWDLQTLRPIRINGGLNRLAAITFSPDGTQFATAGHGMIVQLWNAKTGEQEAIFQGDAGHIFWGWCVQYSPDGKALAVCGNYGALQIWDVAQKRLRFSLKGQTSELRTLAFSHDGRTLASGSSDGWITFWDAQTGQERLTLKGHDGAVRALAFAADGRLLVSAGNDLTIRLWRAAADPDAVARKSEHNSDDPASPTAAINWARSLRSGGSRPSL